MDTVWPGKSNLCYHRSGNKIEIYRMKGKGKLRDYFPFPFKGEESVDLTYDSIFELRSEVEAKQLMEDLYHGETNGN